MKQLLKTYAFVAGDGFRLLAIPLLIVFLGMAIVALVVAAAPFFVIGLIKRELIAALTGGDPLVP